MRPASGRIRVRVADGVAAVTIDNPTQRNAFTREMCLQLQKVMPQLDDDPSVRLITLRGAGATFSAGASISEISSVLVDPHADGTVTDHLSDADDAITGVAKPTMALVDGACMGGGWQIAAACDFVIASARAVFAITPAKIGILYPRLGIERLVRQVGPSRAKHLLFTGRSLTAADAQAIGLIAETVPDDEFDEHCHTLITTMLHRSRFSIHTMKRLIDHTVAADSRLDREWRDAWDAMTNGPDMEIGISAFLERGAPHFQWQP